MIQYLHTMLWPSQFSHSVHAACIVYSAIPIRHLHSEWFCWAFWHPLSCMACYSVWKCFFWAAWNIKDILAMSGSWVSECVWVRASWVFVLDPGYINIMWFYFKTSVNICLKWILVYKYILFFIWDVYGWCLPLFRFLSVVSDTRGHCLSSVVISSGTVRKNSADFCNLTLINNGILIKKNPDSLIHCCFCFKCSIQCSIVSKCKINTKNGAICT